MVIPYSIHSTEILANFAICVHLVTSERIRLERSCGDPARTIAPICQLPHR